MANAMHEMTKVGYDNLVKELRTAPAQCGWRLRQD